MDTEKKTPRVTLKLPFGSRTVRVTALDPSQMVGLSFFTGAELGSMDVPETPEGEPRELPTIYALLKKQAGEREWSSILRDIALGRSTVSDLIQLFGAMIAGSTEAIKAQQAKDAAPKTLDVHVPDPYDAASHGLSAAHTLDAASHGLTVSP